MSILTRDVLKSVASRLNDDLNERWSREELLSYLDKAQLQIAKLVPGTSTTVIPLALAPGVNQVLNLAYLRILDVIHNSNGGVVTRTDRDFLSAQDPAWISATASANAVHWMYDEREPTVYQVYPPQPSSGMGTVTAKVSVRPGAPTYNSGVSLPDSWIAALEEYMLYLAKSKDAEYAAVDGSAVQHLTNFNEIVSTGA